MRTSKGAQVIDDFSSVPSAPGQSGAAYNQYLRDDMPGGEDHSESDTSLPTMAQLIQSQGSKHQYKQSLPQIDEVSPDMLQSSMIEHDIPDVTQEDENDDHEAVAQFGA